MSEPLSSPASETASETISAPQGDTAPIFVHTSGPATMNSYLIIGSDRAVIIDTGAGPAQASGILQAFTAVLDAWAPQLAAASPPAITVINTHDHWDHFFGNAHFAAAGITDFRGSSAFVRDQAASVWVQYHSVPLEAEPNLPGDPSALAVTAAPLCDGDSLDLGGTTLWARELPGHTDTDLVVGCDGAVFVGDLIEEGDPPQAGADATPARWAQVLEQLATEHETAVFLPGHGGPVDAAFVRRQAADLAALATESEAEAPARSAAPFAFLPSPGLPEGVRRIR